MVVLVLYYYLSADRASELHDDPLLEAGCVEYVLLVARKLNHGVTRYVLVFASQTEVAQTNGALLAMLLQIHVVLDDLLFDLEPELVAEGQEPLPVVIRIVVLVVMDHRERHASVVYLYLVAWSPPNHWPTVELLGHAGVMVQIYVVERVLMGGHLVDSD